MSGHIIPNLPSESKHAYRYKAKPAENPEPSDSGDKYTTPAPAKNFRMALVRLSNINVAVESLLHLHNTKVKFNYLRVSFSKYTI